MDSRLGMINTDQSAFDLLTFLTLMYPFAIAVKRRRGCSLRSTATWEASAGVMLYSCGVSVTSSLSDIVFTM